MLIRTPGPFITSAHDGDKERTRQDAHWDGVSVGHPATFRRWWVLLRKAETHRTDGTFNEREMNPCYINYLT